MNKTQKNNLMKKILIAAIVAVAAIIIIISIVLKDHVALYKDESTTGNTSCNLLNGGLFCEVDDKIYFANPNDQNTLYSMDNDLTNIKKVFDDKVSYINGAGNYLFYARRNDQLKNNGDALLSLSTTGLFRFNINSKSVNKLYDDPTQALCLRGNYVYYQHYDQKNGLELYSTKIDGSEGTRLVDEAATPYAVSNDKIYYTGYDKDHYIHSIGIKGSSPSIIYEGNCTNLTKYNDYLYYMDMEKNYILCRIGVDGGTPEVVINKRLATYNISPDGETIYYQEDGGKENGLYKLDLSSGKTTLIAKGNYNYLTLTNKYLFFESFDGEKAYVYDLDTQSYKDFDPEVEK